MGSAASKTRSHSAVHNDTLQRDTLQSVSVTDTCHTDDEPSEGNCDRFQSVDEVDRTDVQPSEVNHDDSSGEDQTESAEETKDNGDVDQKLLAEVSDVCGKMATVVQKNKDDVYTFEFNKLLSSLVNATSEFAGFPTKLMEDCHNKSAEYLTQTDALTVICDVIVDILNSGTYLRRHEEFVAQGVNYVPLALAVHLLWNFTHYCDLVTYGVRDHDRLLPVLLDTLRDWNKEYKDRTLPGFVVDALEGLMSVTHNTAMRADNVTRFRQLDATSVLKLYIDSPREHEQLSAVITLADIVTEEEADSLATSDDVARLLLDSLRRSLDANCRTDGFQVVELTRGVGQLARNDNNSRLLVKEGALPLLLRAAHSEHDDETEAALKTLWMLSFHPDNKEEIIKQEELLDLVVAVFRDEKQTKDCRKSAEGILWELRQELKTTDKYRDVAQEFLDNTTHNGSETATSGISSGHVMLSYQWANQALVKDIRDHLKQNGFKVWMDIDDMDESTLQAMADAVEGAAVVLTCVSQKYKDSPNCRAEAEYAFHRRKPIVPIVTQQGYRADGWLGIILGSKMFYDFSGKYPLPDMYPKLVKAVRRVAGGQSTDNTDGHIKQTPVNADNDIPVIRAPSQQKTSSAPTSPSSSSSSQGMAPSVVEKIRCWTNQDVAVWLTKFALNGKKLEMLTGEEILLLCNLRREAPEYFYNTLEKTLDIKPLSGLVHFLKALDGLPAMVT